MSWFLINLERKIKKPNAELFNYDQNIADIFNTFCNNVLYFVCNKAIPHLVFCKK